VALSVSADVLDGADRDKGHGHLVVCIGFTERGDVIVNNPYARADLGQTVRRVYRRDRVERAWTRSQNAAYFIHPIGRKIPAPFDH
jgi:hypothetical protein